jgi:hypothetical protein
LSNRTTETKQMSSYPCQPYNAVLDEVIENGGATTDASLLASGTLADARLSSNVALENVANVFTAEQRFDTLVGDSNNRMLRFKNADSATEGYYSLFVDSVDNPFTAIQNQVCSLGYNIARSGKDPGNGNHGLRIAMESNYDDVYGWGSQIWESHLISAYTPAGTEYRPITWAGRIDGTRTEGEFHAHAIRFVNPRTTEQAVVFTDFGSGPDNYEVSFLKCLINVGPNNVGVLRQKAADGTTDIELLRTDTSNRVVVGASVTTVIPTLRSTFNTLLCTNGNSGSVFVGTATSGVTRWQINQDSGIAQFNAAESSPRVLLHYSVVPSVFGAGIAMTGGGATATTGVAMCHTGSGILSFYTTNGTALTQRTTINASGVLAHTGNATVSGTFRVGGGTTVTNILSATATLDFPSIAADSFADLTITVTGAVSGDTVIANPIAGSAIADVSYDAWVSAANTVTIRATNNSSTTARDPASGTFRATVIRF